MSDQPSAVDIKWRNALKWACRGIAVLVLVIIGGSLLEATSIFNIPGFVGLKLTQEAGIGMAGLGYLLIAIGGVR